MQKVSDAQEKRTAERFGGRLTPMSGAGWMRKGDVHTAEFMIECKARMDPNAKSYSIQTKDLRDLTKRARLEGRIPLLHVELAGHNYVVLPEGDFLQLIGVEEDD